VTRLVEEGLLLLDAAFNSGHLEQFSNLKKETSPKINTTDEPAATNNVV